MAAAAQQVADSTIEQEEPQKKQGFFSKLASNFSFGGAGGGNVDNGIRLAAPKMLEMDRNLSCEEMDSDDLGGDLNLSDLEDGGE